MKKSLPCDLDWISVHGPNLENELKGYTESEAEEHRQKVLNSPNTEELYTITGVKYYFSSDGDDSNDGLSPQTPFKSLEKIKDLTFRSGDAILFKRNSVYRVKEAIEICSGVTVGSYGEGEKPRFYASLKDYAVSDYWHATDKENVWKADFEQGEACGMFFDHGKNTGTLWKAGVDSLKKNYDYHHDVENNTVYLYFDGGNPGEKFSSIEISYRLHFMFRLNMVTDCVIDNLCIKFSGGFAVVGSGQNISITNCEMGYLGGLHGFRLNVRYGNAIEFSHYVVNLRVENNWIYQTFDTAVSWQLGAEATYENISFSYNLFEYNNADIEFFSKGETVENNFLMKNNLMRFTSSGWGTHDEERGVRGIEGCIRAHSHGMKKFGYTVFEDNVMDCPARQVISWITLPEHKKNIKVRNNKLFLKSSYRTTNMMLRGFSETAEDINIASCADNETEAKEAMKRFQDDLEIYWNEE